MKNSFLLLFLLLLPCIAFSQVAVIIEPVEAGSVSMYPLEVKEFRLTVVNIADFVVENANIVLRVPEEAALVVNGEDRSERYYTVQKLFPGQKYEQVFLVKALEPVSAPINITADFGFEEFNNSSSTKFSIEKSGFLFKARLNKTALSPGDEGEVIFDLVNDSTEKISGIKVQLLSSDSLEIKSAPFETDSLEAGQTIANTSMFFSLGASIGKKTVVARLLFNDSRGSHVLEKSFSLDVQNREMFMFSLVAIIILLVGFSFYMRRKKVPQKVRTEGIKVEDLDEAKKKSA